MREIIRCPHCKLNQFMTSDKNCRKCHLALIPPPPIVELVKPTVPQGVAALVDNGRGVLPEAIVYGKSVDFSRAIKLVRWAHDWSQRELAKAMGVPRTYVSKVEQHHSVPNLASLQRFATALDTTMYGLVRLAEEIS